MKRLCFLSPDLAHARKVVADLRNNGIEEQHIYALARHGVDLEDLPDAGPEADDFLAGYKRGVTLGGSAGVLAGLTALAFPPAGIVIGGGFVLLTGLFGAGVGGLLTAWPELPSPARDCRSSNRLSKKATSSSWWTFPPVKSACLKP
ncbi:MAG: hypothetical protein RJQ10_00185 [Haliea sp.]|uniref:hypothetical protein n=1 Tax=Haliea sp. TaxID=1932666 RepID=UPI0032EC80BC